MARRLWVQVACQGSEGCGEKYSRTQSPWNFLECGWPRSLGFIWGVGKQQKSLVEKPADVTFLPLFFQ